MSVSYKNQMGNVTIDKDVIKKIASYATKESYGLVGMASKDKKTGIVELLNFLDSSKGVNIEIQDGLVYVELFVIVQYGVKVSVVADNLIEKVKYDIENQTDLKVKKVTVNVQGVKVSK
ncbi:Asp23/Gls24 family envelope stress response protein [Criibacterium bergeronii]|uniref:Asp23/Gls24 family envelope stress response protein n=1 Tax=Criibacterium bergeronii TaxID=1871336 RepID=A0A371IKC0_9FIRM|nr:Asp23/Gls24 family envelope stress response protein [Criibacterium bergeronii]MBS6063860.1 Asp23/Gls24 family envelope stress response protein [Peptostreptococcaceae bacterium]RDY20937.1 Asp23/Gls24 family envelope stress response protein [Criibacterium bergeronii]